MHVIVVGAGIDGLSTAWSLAKHGVEVTLFEQADQIPNPLSASGDQHRIIRRAYGGLGGYQRRIDEAYDAWAEMWDDIGERHLVDTGFLLLSQVPGDEADIYRESLKANGYPVEDISPKVLDDQYPFLDGTSLRAASFSDEGGVLLLSQDRDRPSWLARAERRRRQSRLADREDRFRCGRHRTRRRPHLSR